MNVIAPNALSDHNIVYVSCPRTSADSRQSAHYACFSADTVSSCVINNLERDLAEFSRGVPGHYIDPPKLPARAAKPAATPDSC
jgi:hypothetical protein